MTPATPVCDLHPEHGAMQAEHIYLLNGEIDKRYGQYWFCQVEGCPGYGGPVKTKTKVKSPKQELQMELSL